MTDITARHSHLSATAALAAFCASTDTQAMPPALVARVRSLVLDLLGCIIRANRDAPSADALKAGAIALGFDRGSAHVFGDDRTWTTGGAAFLNAALGHALDFDDTHAPSTLHPGAPVIAAAIAAAEMSGASGANLVAGIVSGYEATCRIGLALPAADHYSRGFHPTATCGVFGAAAAAGRVLGLDEDGIERALGIALSQSAGSLQFLMDGAWTKPFQVGWAAQAGLAAATFALLGYRGPREALEGRHGFLQAYAPNPRSGRITDRLGTVFETLATAVKPYPSCRYGHAGIDAVLHLRATHALVPEEIEQITYGVSRAGLLLVGEPADLKRNASNLVQAQFSAPFVLSTALATGEMSWASYANIDDPLIRSLMQKVACVYDPEIEAEFPANMSGRIRIRARGTWFEAKVIVPLGEPSNFLPEDALTAKFASLADPIIGGRHLGLISVTRRLEQIDHINELTTI